MWERAPHPWVPLQEVNDLSGCGPHLSAFPIPTDNLHHVRGTEPWDQTAPRMCARGAGISLHQTGPQGILAEPGFLSASSAAHTIAQ